MDYMPLGKTEISAPPIIFGTSCLGNLYEALPYETKRDIVDEIFTNVDYPVLDTAGKYGAGLALEVIGKTLRELGVPPEKAIISNKLGWTRVPLTTPEPTFEPGAWADLEHDAVQNISYDGIRRCYDQGVELLGGGYAPQIVSVHDPDEYINAAADSDKQRAFKDILEAYRSLNKMRDQGLVNAIGVGAKDWRIIQRLVDETDLDWVMLAVSFTIYTHPPELIDFINLLQKRGISVINSAVFHAGFLTGGSYFDYQILKAANPQHKKYFQWRETFFDLCKKFEILPATACVQFGISHPAIQSVALNTSNAKRVSQNVQSVTAVVPDEFWLAMKESKLIDKDYPYLG